MTVTELAQAIEAHSVEMRALTIGAGVSEATYAKIMEVDSELCVEDLENRLAFLNAVRDKEYQVVKEIWRLLPADIWQRYEDFGETRLREQQLLAEARKALRKVWRKRYGKEEESPAEQGIHQGRTA